MCPDCRAMVEEVAVMKDRMGEMMNRLVMFDAMLQAGKLAELPPLPNDGVGQVACCTIQAESVVTTQSLMVAGRADAHRLIDHASEDVRLALLKELKPRIQFATQQDAFASGTRVVAYLRIAR